ncbi:hypothetical protein MLD52_14350 [Puniceicoccaceae bacterium K14]|nr:hypothetical protein [Puniceicoccaceae bacterium K14]
MRIAADPIIRLFYTDVFLEENDDLMEAPHRLEDNTDGYPTHFYIERITEALGAKNLSHSGNSSELYLKLSPGIYTVTFEDKENAGGLGFIEIYGVDSEIMNKLNILLKE